MGTYFTELAVDLIQTARYQARRAADQTGIDQLAQSVRERGILQPVRVRERQDGFELIAGERRLLAARLAGLATIPAIVVDACDNDSRIDGLVENLQRVDLSTWERSQALLQLRDALGLHSWAEVGQCLGISRVHVHRLLSVGRLPEAMQTDPMLTRITEKHARALLRLRSEPAKQEELWRMIGGEQLSGDEALARSRRLHSPEPRVDDLASESPRATGRGSRGLPGLSVTINNFFDCLLRAEPKELADARLELRDLLQWISEMLRPPRSTTVPRREDDASEAIDARARAQQPRVLRTRASAVDSTLSHAV